jgi:hypothetical protein
MKKNLKAFGSIINIPQILIGLTVLILGTLIYLTDRPPDQTYFLYKSSLNISLHNTLPNLFGTIGNNLPSFIHVFSFILITAGIISSKKNGYIIVCAGWFLIDLIFELGQAYSSLVLKNIPDWFSDVPFLENSKTYFFQGTFDVIDLAAVLIGSLTGYLVLIVTMEKRKI